MPKVFFYDGDAPRDRVYIQTPPPRSRYGFGKFCGDFFMTAITGGLWLFWVVIRQMRRR